MIKLDTQRRLLIPQSLMCLLGLSSNVFIYYCSTPCSIIFAGSFDTAKYGDFIAKAKLDDKNRIIIPKIVHELMKEKQWLEHGILCINSNRNLCIKGTS